MNNLEKLEALAAKMQGAVNPIAAAGLARDFCGVTLSTLKELDDRVKKLEAKNGQ